MTPTDDTRIMKIIDAILETAPKERPRDVYDFPDGCYDAYREGQKSILWTLVKELERAAAPAADGEDSIVSR